MKNSRTTLLPYTALTFVTLIVTPSFAEIPPLVGTVTHVFGTATLQHGLHGGAKPVQFKDKVHLQDTISTDEESVVRVLMGDKALVTISEMSVLTITEEMNHATIDIESGSITLSVARKRMNPGEYIEIRTPHAVAAIRGTKLVAEVANKHSSRFSILEGKVDAAHHKSDPTNRFPMLRNQVFEFHTPQFSKPRVQKFRRKHNEMLKANAATKGHQLRDNVVCPAEEDVVKKQMVQATALANQFLAPQNPGNEVHQQVASLGNQETNELTGDSNSSDTTSGQVQESPSSSTTSSSNSGNSVPGNTNVGSIETSSPTMATGNSGVSSSSGGSPVGGSGGSPVGGGGGSPVGGGGGSPVGGGGGSPIGGGGGSPVGSGGGHSIGSDHSMNPKILAFIEKLRNKGKSERKIWKKVNKKFFDNDD
ncbi:MAG: FecR family protein [Nitrospirota bacterium]|nr:FecR family protein [Nitrospirota bacterium]